MADPSNPSGDSSQVTHLDLRDYLTAASDAATRTRKLIFVLAIVSIIMFAGMLNSLYHSWAAVRILASRNPDSEYVIDNIGPPPAAVRWKDDRTRQGYSDARRVYEEHYHDFYSALMRSYV